MCGEGVWGLGVPVEKLRFDLIVQCSHLTPQFAQPIRQSGHFIDYPAETTEAFCDAHVEALLLNGAGKILRTELHKPHWEGQSKQVN